MADTETTKSATPAAKAQTKTEFVLGFPRETAAAEIVAKGKSAGFTIAVEHVHKIRSLAKKAAKKKRGAKKAAKAAPAKSAAVAKPSATPKAKAPAKAAKKVAAKPVAKKSVGKRGGRSNPKKAFIASQPRSMPAVEVVAAAKKAGLSISLDYVYKARSKAGAAKAPAAAAAPVVAKPKIGRPKGSKNRKSAAAKTAVTVKTTPVAATGSTDAAMEHVLARFVVAHGASRVRQVLAGVEARVNELFGGV